MTLSLAWWVLRESNVRLDEHDEGKFARFVSNVALALPSVAIAGSPYHTIGRTMNWLDTFNRSAHAQLVARNQYNYMVKHGMKISKSSHRHFAAL